MQETDRGRFNPGLDHAPADRGNILLVREGNDASVGGAALGNLEDERARHERGRDLGHEVEDVGNAMARDVEEVAEAFGDEEGGARARALDDRVYGKRGAVHEIADLPGAEAAFGEDARGRREQRGLGAGGVGGCFENADGARLFFEQREVGEGSADIDSQPVCIHPRPPRHRTAPGGDGRGSGFGGKVTCFSEYIH